MRGKFVSTWRCTLPDISEIIMEVDGMAPWMTFSCFSTPMIVPERFVEWSDPKLDPLLQIKEPVGHWVEPS